MENPGFYAILPASVRYDNRLKAAEKIFYAEITALSDQSGYCYAGNGYFCQLYDTTDRTVQRWVKHLQELGYVAVTYAREGTTNQRRISPRSGSVPDICAENHPDKNVGENNTRITIQVITIYGRARVPRTSLQMLSPAMNS